MKELCVVCGEFPMTDSETGYCERCRIKAFDDECQAQQERFMQEMGLI